MIASPSRFKDCSAGHDITKFLPLASETWWSWTILVFSLHYIDISLLRHFFHNLDVLHWQEQYVYLQKSARKFKSPNGLFRIRSYVNFVHPSLMAHRCISKIGRKKTMSPFGILGSPNLFLFIFHCCCFFVSNPPSFPKAMVSLLKASFSARLRDNTNLLFSPSETVNKRAFPIVLLLPGNAREK